MYTAFYKLRDLPFQLTPDSRFFFNSSEHAKAMAYLTYGLHQGEGFIVITGEVGAGKTTLLDYLLSTLDSATHVAAKIVTTQLGADDIVRMVAAAFGIAEDGAGKAILLRRIEAFLAACHRDDRRALLMVDEVQNLPSEALEELRMLSNIVFDHSAPLQSFLVGQPQFRSIIASPPLEQLRQRVTASYHLQALNACETRTYVEHRLRIAGWDKDPDFTEAAFHAIFAVSGGIPRRINTLCARLLLYGYLEEKHAVTEAMVGDVASEMQGELRQVATPHLSCDVEAMERRERASAVGMADLTTRVNALQLGFERHDKVIKRAIEVAADYLQKSRHR